MGMEVIIPEMPFEAIGIELEDGGDRTVTTSMGFQDEMREDPFGTAMVWMRTILEHALDDKVSGRMSDGELDILHLLNRTVLGTRVG